MDCASEAVRVDAHRRFLRLAPFFALGPISGPLTAGVVMNYRGGRPILASLYGLALGLWLVMAPMEAAHLLPMVKLL